MIFLMSHQCWGQAAKARHPRVNPHGEMVPDNRPHGENKQTAEGKKLEIQDVLLMRRVIKRWSNSPSSFHPGRRATSGGSSNLFQGWRGDVTTPNADTGQVSQLEGEGA